MDKSIWGAFNQKVRTLKNFRVSTFYVLCIIYLLVIYFHKVVEKKFNETKITLCRSFFQAVIHWDNNEGVSVSLSCSIIKLCFLVRCVCVARCRIPEVLQSEGLIPHGVQATFDGLGLLLALTFGIRNQLELDVGVWQAIGVHGHQVLGLFDCRGRSTGNIFSQLRWSGGLASWGGQTNLLLHSNRPIRFCTTNLCTVAKLLKPDIMHSMSY